MARDEFDSEMENYLAERRKEPLLSTILNRKKETKKTQEVELPITKNQSNFNQSETELSASVSNDSPETGVEKDEKKGFWSSLWNGFSAHDPEPSIQLAPAQSDELLQDFKVVAKISLTIMKQLPEQELLKLKGSNDFVKFKEILKKHSIIK